MILFNSSIPATSGLCFFFLFSFFFFLSLIFGGAFFRPTFLFQFIPSFNSFLLTYFSRSCSILVEGRQKKENLFWLLLRELASCTASSIPYLNSRFVGTIFWDTADRQNQNRGVLEAGSCFGSSPCLGIPNSIRLRHYKLATCHAP